MSYDPVSYHIVTADETGGSNGIVPKHGRIKIHKVVLQGDGSNAVAVALHDAATIVGTAVIGLANHETVVDVTGKYTTITQSDFNPPVPFEVGLSIDVTGTGAIARVYYTAG